MQENEYIIFPVIYCQGDLGLRKKIMWKLKNKIALSIVPIYLSFKIHPLLGSPQVTPFFIWFIYLFIFWDIVSV